VQAITVASPDSTKHEHPAVANRLLQNVDLMSCQGQHFKVHCIGASNIFVTDNLFKIKIRCRESTIDTMAFRTDLYTRSAPLHASDHPLKGAATKKRTRQKAYELYFRNFVSQNVVM
jgi:hypothetical protein